MKKIILYLIVVILIISCKNQSKPSTDESIQPALVTESSFKNDTLSYAYTLRSLFGKIQTDQNLELSLLAKSIPTNQVDYLHLYSYTSSDTSATLHLAYYRRDSLINQAINKGHITIIRNYLLYANMVDGEEAEGFFEDLEYHYSVQPDSFCVAISQLLKTEDRKELWRVEELIKKCEL